MPEISVEIEIWCSCGDGLCNQTTTKKNRHGDEGFIVEPCTKCIERAKTDGYEKGYKDGTWAQRN